MQNRTIAIIGAGFSGLMVAVHLLRKATAPLTIQLIERRSPLGQGVAYSTQLDCHLLNVPVGKISAFSEDPTHFLRWLHQQGFTEIAAETFAPRKLYGKYLQATLAAAVQNASPGVQLECLEDEAIALKPDDDRAVVYLSSGKTLTVDRVVLASGNLPPSHPAIEDPTFYQSPRYVRSAWTAELSQLPADAPVLLIGSGLTAIDTILTLQQQGHQGKIQLVSRRGLLPQSHRSHHASINCQLPPEMPKTLRSLLWQFRQTGESVTAQGGDWRQVIDALRPQTQMIWQQLSPTEQRRFLRHLRPYWESHRHRLAPAIAQTIERLQASGQLQQIAGRIQAFQADATGVDVLIRPKGSQALMCLRSHLVINCTGSESDYRKAAQPLIQNLLATGLSRPDRLRLGLEVDATGALINAAGKASSWLYTLGSTQKGRLWETTAVPELREQANQLAQRLCQPTFAEADSMKAFIKFQRDRAARLVVPARSN